MKAWATAAWYALPIWARVVLIIAALALTGFALWRFELGMVAFLAAAFGLSKATPTARAARKRVARDIERVEAVQDVRDADDVVADALDSAPSVIVGAIVAGDAPRSRHLPN